MQALLDIAFYAVVALIAYRLLNDTSGGTRNRAMSFAGAS